MFITNLEFFSVTKRNNTNKFKLKKIEQFDISLKTWIFPVSKE